MAIEELPGEVQVLPRDEIARQYRRDYGLRIPEADTGPGTQPYVDAAVLADALMILHDDARKIGNGTALDTSRGEHLLRHGTADGIPPPPASVSSGFVTITTAVGGATILAGDELIDQTNTGLRFACTETHLYADGDEVPIASIDTGPATNLAAGTVLTWTNPRAGCAPDAIIFENSDGTGLTGGRDAATDEEYIQVIKERRANPPASGNDAAYRLAVRRFSGLSVEQVWTIPAVRGPGTTGILFTMKPARLGGARLPNAAQITIAEETLKAEFPADDGIFMVTIVEQPVELALEILWAQAAVGFADTSPWPPFVAAGPVRVKAAPAPTATTFTLFTTDSTTDPQVGQTIALYDIDAGLFRRKRIGTVVTVTPSVEWNITVVTTSAASDTTFTPAAGDIVSPWSDSLNTLVVPVLIAFAELGPGEQFATFPDPGARQKRQPESPAQWPSVLTNKTLLNDIFDVPGVADADVLLPATLPFESTIGTPAVTAYLLTLGGLGIFAET